MTASAANHLTKYSNDTVPWLMPDSIDKGEVGKVFHAMHNLYRPVRMAGTGAVTTVQAYEWRESGSIRFTTERRRI